MLSLALWIGLIVSAVGAFQGGNIGLGMRYLTIFAIAFLIEVLLGILLGFLFFRLTSH